MKIQKLFHLFSISLIVIGLMSCIDENNELRLPVENVNILPEGQATINILGGDAPYSVISDNEKVVMATIENKVINISSKNQGTAVLTIKDNSNASTTLTVEVKSQIQNFEIEKYGYSVEATNESVKTAINNELRNNLPLPVGGRYELEFVDSKMNHGNLKIYSTQDVNGFISGTFKMKLGDFHVLVTLNYNDNEIVYKWAEMIGATASKNQFWLEDLTKSYQALYPNAGITNVERTQVFKMISSK